MSQKFQGIKSITNDIVAIHEKVRFVQDFMSLLELSLTLVSLLHSWFFLIYYPKPKNNKVHWLNFDWFRGCQQFYWRWCSKQWNKYHHRKQKYVRSKIKSGCLEWMEITQSLRASISFYLIMWPSPQRWLLFSFEWAWIPVYLQLFWNFFLHPYHFIE